MLPYQPRARSGNRTHSHNAPTQTPFPAQTTTLLVTSNTMTPCMWCSRILQVTGIPGVSSWVFVRSPQGRGQTYINTQSCDKNDGSTQINFLVQKTTYFHLCRANQSNIVKNARYSQHGSKVGYGVYFNMVFCTLLCYYVLCSVILHSSLLFCTMFCYFVLCSLFLYSTLFFCNILNPDILYCTQPCYSLFCSVILYFAL